MKDALGDRMKDQYENRTRAHLPRRTYTLIRVDGKAFHTFTRNCKRPYDENLMSLMDATAFQLCQEIQGAVCAFVQSDEISILLTDFAKPTTDAWFDGNIQKITSVSASIATAAFNSEMLMFGGNEDDRFEGLAYFDSRVFTIPDPTEVENYFIWRQQDASRNSLQMVARSLYSHKELEGKKTDELHELIHQKGQNWNNHPDGFKRGRMVVRRKVGTIVGGPDGPVSAWAWTVEAPPIFTQERGYLSSLIPRYGNEEGKNTTD